MRLWRVWRCWVWQSGVGVEEVDLSLRGIRAADDAAILLCGSPHPSLLDFTLQPGTGALWVNVVGDNYEQVFNVGRRDKIGDNPAQNENAIPFGTPSPYARYITPIIKYRTNGSDTRNIAASGASGAVRSGNVFTLYSRFNSRPMRAARATAGGLAA